MSVRPFSKLSHHIRRGGLGFSSSLRENTPAEPDPLQAIFHLPGFGLTPCPRDGKYNNHLLGIMPESSAWKRNERLLIQRPSPRRARKSHNTCTCFRAGLMPVLRLLSALLSCRDRRAMPVNLKQHSNKRTLVYCHFYALACWCRTCNRSWPRTSCRPGVRST